MKITRYDFICGKLTVCEHGAVVSYHEHVDEMTQLSLEYEKKILALEIELNAAVIKKPSKPNEASTFGIQSNNNDFVEIVHGHTNASNKLNSYATQTSNVRAYVLTPVTIVEKKVLGIDL